MAASATSPQHVERVIAQLDALPPLAPVTPRILALTMDANASLTDLVEAVSSDPSLTARVLSIMGRAHHGVRPRTADLAAAIKYLGFAAIRQLALATKVMEVFGCPPDNQSRIGLDRAEFWRHCLGVACAAGRIAREISGAVTEAEAFVLGLLHDLGKIALDEALPKSYERVIRELNRQPVDISQAERGVLGVDHTVVGRRLSEKWSLPQRLIDVIWLHHQSPWALPSTAAADGHVQIVQLADAWVRSRRIGFSGTRHECFNTGKLAESLGLSAEVQANIVESLGELIESRAEWIGRIDLTSREVYVRALVNTTTELTTANAQLLEQNTRLVREARFFAALGRLNVSLTPKAAVREVCGIGAEVTREALGLERAAMVVSSEDGRWLEVGISDHGAITTDFRESTAPAQAVTNTSPGTCDAMARIVPADTAEEQLAEPIRHQLGVGPLWKLPVTFRGQIVGTVFFTTDQKVVAPLVNEVAQLDALCAALGLAVSQARTLAELRAVNDELVEANRRQTAMQGELIRTHNLQSIVAMAAGAAHELNNPLAVISGRAQWLNQGATTDQQPHLEQIAAQANTASNIVTELMEFASPRQAAPREVALQDLLSALRTELMDAGLLADGSMEINVSSDTPAIWFDPEYARRMFRELLDNALEATYPEDRRLTVKAWRDPSDVGVVVQVVDNGRGMTHEVLGRAMDPFFSHRPAGRGRGLGLSRVSRWLADAGGSISIESSPGQGACVELRLPTRSTGD